MTTHRSEMRPAFVSCAMRTTKFTLFRSALTCLAHSSTAPFDLVDNHRPMTISIDEIYLDDSSRRTAVPEPSRVASLDRVSARRSTSTGSIEVDTVVVAYSAAQRAETLGVMIDA